MTSGEPPVYSVVVPVFCEAAGLAGNLGQIRAALAGLGEPGEIVVVDDGSTDGSWDVLRDLAGRWPELRALRFTRNFGKEAAMLAGLRASRGRAVIVMDSDLQHPPRLLPEMAALWRGGEGFAVVNAVKRRRGSESVLRAAMARLYYAAFERLAGVPLAGHSDFKLLDRRVVDAYCGFRERNLFFRGLVRWIGHPQAEVAFDVAPRRGGGSKWSVFRLGRLAFDSLASFSSLPLQVITLSGLLFMLAALAVAVQTLSVWLSGGAVEGFTTVILLLLLIGSLLMVALGVIGQYLAKIYDEVKRRPRYVVGARIGTTPVRDR